MVNTEFNREKLTALSGLSDGELKEKILSAASACGIDRNAAEKRLPDMSVIKKKLASLSDRDIKMLISVIGEENAKKLKEGLENGSKQ